ncbi:MAG: hypothetical protein IK091_05495 [Spirochaetales bacterium]|nr:hypothetical protein [Spirochaetales bacterium]
MRDRIISAIHVDTFPEILEQGKVYISDECKVSVHLCCCGCGEKVVLPFDNPTVGWTYTEIDGKPTFSPSVGSFNLPCKSHYFIRKGVVIWC